MQTHGLSGTKEMNLKQPETHRVLEARDAGITEFLAKPVSARGLYQRITMVIERPRQFIKTRTYTGPDRRRVPATERNNKGRRSSDQSGGSDELSQDDIEKLMNSWANTNAHDQLETIACTDARVGKVVLFQTISKWQIWRVRQRRRTGLW